MLLQELIVSKVYQWNLEAKLNFARRFRENAEMIYETWANGETMVGFEGDLPNQFISADEAQRIIADGGKVRI